MFFMTRAKRPILKANGESFGQRLRRLRKAQGLTQTELGTRIDVSMRAICSYERDECEPTVELIVALSKSLGVSLDEMTGITSSKIQATPAIERRLFKRFNQINELSERKKQTILQVLDMALGSKA